jgi:penicillin-binding protein 1A
VNQTPSDPPPPIFPLDEGEAGPGFGRRPAPPATPRGAPPPRRRGGAARIWAGIGAVFLALIVVAGIALFTASQTYLTDVPPIPARDALWAVRRTPGMTFLDHSGAIIATRGAKYGQRVRLSELPPYMIKAVLAAEDRRFYEHGAVDVRGIARAMSANAKAGRSVQGASTLTQQLARTLFLNRENSLKRKVQEAVLAWRLEQMLTKDDVLELYLNRTYFGAGAYGLDAAARTYFGRPASALTLSEAATLAAIPNAPSRLALNTGGLPAAWARARRVLAIMREEGWITPQQEDFALQRPPTLAPSTGGEGAYSYILDQAAGEANALAGGVSPDLVVRLTIDPKLQQAGLAAVTSVVGKEGRGRRVSQGALVALAPDGAIRAMVGGLDHDRSAFNRVTQARRQPGSSFKAFVFGAAMERGLQPSDVRLDAPIAMGKWNPENYGGSYAGPVTLQQALARSINTVSVRITEEVGPSVVGEFARRCGIATIPADPGPSIALGAYEVTLLELARGYQVFQNGGGRTTPYLIESVATTSGNVIFTHPVSAPLPVYDPLFATRMVEMLKTVITAGTGTRANIGRPAAGKTGTSQNWRDAWFVGFTPDLLAGVWVGNDDNTPMAHVTGGELPAEIWKRFMTVAEKDVTPTDFPWLSPEPPTVEMTSAEGGTIYEDQPYIEGGGAVTPSESAPPDEGYEGPGRIENGRPVPYEDAPPPEERRRGDRDEPGPGSYGPPDQGPPTDDREAGDDSVQRQY